MQVPANGVVDVFMRRWIDMASKGWYSGQTHIHTTDIGMPVSALITKGSVENLDLHPDKEIWISFKASAARFIRE